MVIDGMGEAHSVTLYRACDGRLEPLLEIGAHDSIGVLYSLITLHLGFDFNSDEYKIMGLAPYGDPARARAFFEAAVQFRPDGSIRIPALRLHGARNQREFYTLTRQLFERTLVKERRPDD